MLSSINLTYFLRSNTFKTVEVQKCLLIYHILADYFNLRLFTSKLATSNNLSINFQYTPILIQYSTLFTTQLPRIIQLKTGH